MVGTSTYVEPAIEVSENAYVFAVSMDLDGQIFEWIRRLEAPQVARMYLAQAESFGLVTRNEAIDSSGLPYDVYAFRTAGTSD